MAKIFTKVTASKQIEFKGKELETIRFQNGAEVVEIAMHPTSAWNWLVSPNTNVSARIRNKVIDEYVANCLENNGVFSGTTVTV